MCEAVVEKHTVEALQHPGMEIGAELKACPTSCHADVACSEWKTKWAKCGRKAKVNWVKDVHEVEEGCLVLRRTAVCRLVSSLATAQYEMGRAQSLTGGSLVSLGRWKQFILCKFWASGSSGLLISGGIGGVGRTGEV